MRVVNAEVVALTAPYRDPDTPADQPANGMRNCVWLRLDTDGGISGWGEAYCGVYATEVTMAALRRLLPSLLRRDASEPRALMQWVRDRNRYWAMRGIGAQSTSAIEAALWDIVGKSHDQPVWQLLGDGRPRPVLLYASVGDNSLSPAEIRDEARRYALAGYRAYKLRCGGHWGEEGDRLALDAERVSAAREGLGSDRLLFVDVSVPQRPEPWAPGRAEAYMEALAPYDVRFIEEPAMTYDVARYRELQQRGLIPTAGGESFTCPEEFEPFFEAGAYGVAQPDAAVVGGPASCVDVLVRAHALGVPSCLHSLSAGVGIAQNLHAACAVDGVLAMEGAMVIHAPASEPLRPIWRLADGYLVPPSAPGLGVSITDDLLATCRYRPGQERDL
jgi:L-alanine-DL-glutamate epimerase-like enolase superfamily enzyme